MLNDRCSWDLGACLPPDFVEALARRQPRLRELQFTTDVKCLGPPEDDAKRINGAGACFKKLRRFCWRGYTSMRQPIQLAEIVEANCQQLEELELDFGSRWLRKERKELTGELGSRGRLVHVLPQTVPSAPASFVFPALRVLSLTGVDLRDTAGKLNGAFDFESLESLSLRTCYNWQDFLAKIARSGVQIKLKRLEIKGAEDSDRYGSSGYFSGHCGGWKRR
ncbi:hypothetical protein N656DRAFT_62912 [Canariomyces notabilis]|uniref:Uncharacterized protein n=1 Tax=Canariomyces notabilis TaxID=2074819 RepID=A0AAN6TNN5_9PEZI|nr:hypothetical protein N656DRAFT_62912 [Canariomyces arenarius]